MDRYDYESAVKADVKKWLEDHYKDRRITESERDEIYDELFVSDSVTGNGSGSYTFSSWDAEEHLCHNLDLLQEAIEEFGGDIDVLSKGAESCDVTIRCYILGQVLYGCVKEHNEAIEEAEGEDDEAKS